MQMALPCFRTLDIDAIKLASNFTLPLCHLVTQAAGPLAETFLFSVLSHHVLSIQARMEHAAPKSQ